MAAPNTKNFKELVHPELASGWWVPTINPESYLFKLLGPLLNYLRPASPVPANVTARKITVTSLDGQYEIPAYLSQPSPPPPTSGLRPGVLWIHGGGMVLGSYTMDLERLHKYTQPSADCFGTGAVTLAPDYRLAPAHRGQTLVDDCYAAWKYLIDNASELHLDTSKIIIGGASAGGGLAAALVQRIKDDGGIQPVFQLLVYPMADDRTVLYQKSGKIASQTHYPLWGPIANRYGWTSYLGHEPALDKHSDLVPARRADLSGLPSAWIGVGTLDLFHEEDVEYARRLKEAGVDVHFEAVEGAWHGFEMVRQSKVVRDFWDSQVRAMKQALR